jgi:hypothetical protein
VQPSASAQPPLSEAAGPSEAQAGGEKPAGEVSTAPGSDGRKSEGRGGRHRLQSRSHSRSRSRDRDRKRGRGSRSRSRSRERRDRDRGGARYGGDRSRSPYRNGGRRERGSGGKRREDRPLFRPSGGSGRPPRREDRRREGVYSAAACACPFLWWRSEARVALWAWVGGRGVATALQQPGCWLAGRREIAKPIGHGRASPQPQLH